MFLFAFLHVCIHIACCFVATTISGERPPKRAKLQTEEQDLQEQLALDVRGQYAAVKQKRAAGFSSEESLLYVRGETVELWNALNSTTNGNKLIVDGPPGTGKSIEVWAWALWKARKQKLKVTWYHMNKSEVVKVLIDGVVDKITTGYTAEITDIKDSEGSILIVDGVISSENFTVRCACSNWCKSMSGRRFVLVSSVSTPIALQEKKEAGIVDFTVGSWTFEQYQEACKDETFFEHVVNNMRCPGIGADADKHKLLLSKYYFAGGCARWMFEFSYNDFIIDLKAHLQKVGDYNSLWTGGGGDETIVAVNHLRGVTMVVDDDQIETKKYFFISQHVAAVLAVTCSDRNKFLIDSYKIAAATKNPAFEGWIFEFDVDYQLSQACSKKEKFRAKMRSQTDDFVLIDEDRSVDMYEVFNSDDELSAQIKLLDVNRMLWAKPQRWCQKAYDFLCVWKDDSNALKMVVANATLAKTHSVLLTEVNNLASALGVRDCVISAIRFDFIVPENADFTIGDICGRLCDWDNLRGKKWPNKPSSEAYTDCLSVIEVVRTS